MRTQGSVWGRLPTRLPNRFEGERHKGYIGQVLPDTLLKAKVMKQTSSGKLISGQKENLLTITSLLWSRTGSCGRRDGSLGTPGPLHVEASALTSPSALHPSGTGQGLVEQLLAGPQFPTWAEQGPIRPQAHPFQRPPVYEAFLTSG